jgi:hypothetical protein
MSDVAEEHETPNEYEEVPIVDEPDDDELKEEDEQEEPW